MEITNKENYITNDQINKILEILGREHTPRRIIVYENKLDKLTHKILHPLDYKESLSVGDYYNVLNDTIYLQVEKFEDEEKLEYEDIQFNLIRDLAYLVKQRHYFSDYLKDKDFSLKDAINNLDIFSINDINYGFEIYKDGRYDDLIDKFVIDFMNNNSKQIQEIMGWKEESFIEE